ncbi:HEPN domain-containing protein [Pontibacter pudoricolor]|uniref:HEPN domain-containing protein n=1 Tax=Pontibacter pudoricolor TaxID=2694930 RepID=UPI001390AE27|nr:HEPN domain-containing protein [Pontibacter pudoricolor]
MIIYIPIRGPEIPKLNSEFERFLKDFHELSETDQIRELIDYEVGHQYIASLSFHIIDTSIEGKVNKEIELISEGYSFFRVGATNTFIKIELNLVYTIDDKIFAEIKADNIISKLSLLISLTYATKVDFLEGVILSNDHSYLGKSEILLSTIDYAYEHALKVGWPKITTLELSKTLAWFKDNSLHTDGCSKNKLHRAINAFSYQFSALHEHDTSILFWTVLGIEALLAEGNTNIMNQIKIKSSIILGQPLDYKKKLDKLYNYRSRFVHGEINFPPKFSDDYDNFEIEYWDYLHFATSILISLIRYLISENKVEYRFEYSLSN